ncbi:2-oxoglutarate dehydrogenase E1 component [Peribacillus deserti]|uniref:2-oxoglutarate dehydrogenase E1 component n=1 Tax=Peribacillus deserti TaxID=673318 RepID=A0ABS2QM90_9BACI|nr:2-oxoglutarate dehydrogenase E1 component [Peribacillus deserti]MBM7693356.1 2-oxoglutarate dehydrogenase E1 component [Peribacillus deserti]
MTNIRSMELNPWAGLSGPNLGYVLEQYDLFVQDPDSVGSDLKELFITWGSPEQAVQLNHIAGQAAAGQTKTAGVPLSTDIMKKVMSAVQLAENIRAYGHLAANIYPLNEVPKENDVIRLSNYDLTDEDLRKIPADLLSPYLPAHIKDGLEAIQYLKEAYSKTIAFQFHHVNDMEEKYWLNEMVESGRIFRDLTNEEKVGLYKRLSEVDSFEKFLHRTFVGQKRFSIEGLDTLVPVLDEIVSEAVQSGTQSINIAMAHRGRLSVLAHVLGKPYEVIFSEFQHAPNKELVPSEGSIGINFGWTGDVKYHLGADRQIKDESTVKARITLANNPSHLEFVGSIVEGFTRAAQDDRSEPGYPVQDDEKSLAIIIHGDAAFPGEGIVAETLNLSGLKGYKTGGTVHIITNNMIGFTTESEDSRSTKYASDLAKGYEIPIVHVNADDPEACIAAVELAYQYRKKFKKDFLIDLIGYRRFGHNEMDEPLVTNPQMYNLIHKHPVITEIYGKKLTDSGVLTQARAAEIKEQVDSRLKEAYSKVDTKNKKEAPDDLVPPETVEHGLPRIDTSVSLDTLQQINSELVQWPKDFKIMKKLEKILTRRLDAFNENGKIDWAQAETLAFASILGDGTPIRITGQDSERGTFAHRHLVLHDYETGKKYSPLHTLSLAKSSFAIHNSPLTETAVLGFEYGYNIYSPETLVLWEAQYGDFANVAQVIFDQFIAAGRAKWGQKSGLVMLFPHGYEGQGPEHSSGRLERFLQLAAENNWTVANLSSAAQYFHILRRQAAILTMEEVRPLVIMAPKSLLRNPLTSSSPEDFTEGEFKAYIEEPLLGNNPEAVERIVFTTGKMSIDLSDSLKDKKDMDWLHIIRLEEIYPFPFEEVQKFLKGFKNLKEIVWTQEEPKNMGAWSFVEPRLATAAPDGVQVSYYGRKRRSSPAEGDPMVHKKEQQRIIDTTLTRN